MAITISGENNNDKILASDGVIDELSGLNLVGVITATSFTGDVTGNLTGNVTGNINNTTLLLQTGGNERIRINSNGSIQITPEASTSNPYALIDTSGDSVRLHAKKSSGNNEFRFLTQSSGTVDERLRITSGGSVNIGTGQLDQSARMLNVYGGAIRATQTTGGNSIEAFGQSTSGQSYGLLASAGTTANDYAGLFRKYDGTTIIKMRGDGKVGIGTDTPEYQTTIAADGANAKLNIKRKTATSSNNNAYGSLFYTNNLGTDLAAIRAQRESANTNAFLSFWTHSGSSLEEKLRIHSDGNVTKPKNAMFKAMMTASYNPGSTGWKTIPYNTDSQTGCFDVGDNFNTSTHRFTAPVDGYYFFGLNQRVDSGDSNYFRVAFGLDGDYNSGGDYPYGHAIYKDADAFSFYSFSITSLNYMTAGQYMIAMGYSNTDTNFYWQNESIFYGFLLQ